MISLIKSTVYPFVTTSKSSHCNVFCSRRTLHGKPILKGKILGRTKHYPPGISEWKDNGYFYNKNNMKTLPVKYNIAEKYIKGYFNITGLKEMARSKRMRSKIVRFSTRKLFVSKPEIKHSNDIANVTFYIFNREKQFYVRKLFFYKRKSSLYNAWLLNSLDKKIRIDNIKSKRKVLFKNKVKKSLPYYGIKLDNELDFLKYKLRNLSKKLIHIDQYLMFLFLSSLLSMLNIKVFNPLIHQKDIFIRNILSKTPYLLFLLDTKANRLKIVNNSSIKLELLKKALQVNGLSYNINNQGLLNNYLWQFIKDNYLATGLLKEKNISLLYKIFVYNKFKKIISTLFNKQAKLFFNYGKLQINKIKYTSLLPVLKKFLKRIYNKATVLNIVNLKYLHLNSDIFTQAVALKLRKKQSFLKVLRKSLKLVKVPFEYLYREKINNLNKFLDLNKFKSSNLKALIEGDINKLNSNDNIHNLFNRIFPASNSMVHKTNLELGVVNNGKKGFFFTMKNKPLNILDSIKFKWVSGLRLEAAGRLTRRNTASRSSFKLMYKGNLKSKQYYIEHDLLKTMPTIMLRNNSKVNTQYTLTKSKRRIGSFGIKSWISSY